MERCGKCGRVFQNRADAEIHAKAHQQMRQQEVDLLRSAFQADLIAKGDAALLEWVELAKAAFAANLQATGNRKEAFARLGTTQRRLLKLDPAYQDLAGEALDTKSRRFDPADKAEKDALWQEELRMRAQRACPVCGMSPCGCNDLVERVAILNLRTLAKWDRLRTLTSEKTVVLDRVTLTPIATTPKGGPVRTFRPPQKKRTA